jgi:hypothetical protein
MEYKFQILVGRPVSFHAWAVVYVKNTMGCEIHPSFKNVE